MRRTWSCSWAERRNVLRFPPRIETRGLGVPLSFVELLQACPRREPIDRAGGAAALEV
jgi:hypothetical protein